MPGLLNLRKLPVAHHGIRLTGHRHSLVRALSEASNNSQVLASSATSSRDIAEAPDQGKGFLTQPQFDGNETAPGDGGIELSGRRISFSKSVGAAAVLVFGLAITFAVFVSLEQAGDRAHEVRFTSVLLADELRQSSDDLTRMARSYVITGDPDYRRDYQKILDIRDGRALRPAGYVSIDPDLLPGNAMLGRARAPVPLLQLMREAGFSADELEKLATAKAKSDSLTRLEFAAMDLAGSRTGDAEANRERAIGMLYDARYGRERVSIMKPIDEFLVAVDRRTRAAVDDAERTAAIIRYVFVALGLALMLMFWSSYAALRRMMGGSVNDVYREIRALGSGDFTTAHPVKRKHLESVRGWLSGARSKLNEERVAQDLGVTNLKLAQSALRHSEQQYRLLFDHNPSPMWVYDESTRAFLAVNEAAIRRYGYTREVFLSMTRHDVRVEPLVPATESALPSCDPVDNGSWTGQHLRNDGSVIDVEVTSQAIDFDGHHARLALALDVTARRRAEEAQRQSEQRTRLIIDTALDAVITMRASGAISDWSAQAEKMFGWSSEEAIGQQMSDTIIPHRYREAHNRGLRKFLRTGEGPMLNKRIEITALNRDGHEFPIELAISPTKLGEEWIFSAFIRDLTEQRKSEELVRLGELRYQQLFEDIPVGLYRSTPEGKLIDVNPAMVRMLGYPNREALIATPAGSLYKDAADRVRWRSQMSSDEGVDDFDVQLTRADGSTLWVSDTTYMKRDSGGAILYYEGVLEDITARVETERATQASERRLFQILEAVPLGIIVSDQSGTPVFANAGAQNILGKGVVPGTVAGELAQVYQAYLAGTNEPYPVEKMPLLRALTGEAAAVEDMEIHRENRVISLHVQGAPLVDEDGRVVAAVAVFLNTTDRRALETQLRQTSKMEAVGQLAGGVAHDFNNLLTVIMSYSAMLLEDVGSASPLHADVYEIAAAADRAAGLTRQLLAFSRQQVMQPRVMDINSVISDVEKMLRRIIGEDIELAIGLDHDLAKINADPGQLEQVLMNLVVNARDAMPSGGRLGISTSNSALSAESAGGTLHPPDGEYVMLAVSDTGTGMTSEVQQRLFDPFFTTKDMGRGTGLGLSTVYGIVKQSGGEIYVYSEVGQGSTFKVYFPRVAASASTGEREIRSHDVPRGSESILLVEDDTNLRNLVARVLTNCGYTVHAASGGIDALAISGNPATVIDAVITDVVMPGMNGRQLVEKLIEERPGIGSLLMSGYTDDDVLRRGVMHGETAFLQKPFTPDQLARKIRSVLDRTLVMSVALQK